MKSVRRDASNNIKQIIETSAEILSQRGVEISVKEIITLLDVSKATFYRHFSSKEVLIEAILDKNIEDIQSYSEGLLNEKEDFVKLLIFTSNLQLKFQALSSFLKLKKKNELKEKIILIFSKSVHIAQQEKFLFQGFDIEKDLILIINMLGGSLASEDDNERIEEINRALFILSNGFKNRKHE